PGRPVDPSTRLNAADWRDIVLITLASCALVWLVIAVGGFVGKGTMFVGGLAVTGAAIAGQRVFSKTEAKHEPLTKEEWQRIAVIAILAFFNIFFWMGFEQAGGTFTLFADKQTDRHLFGWEIPASYFQSINPLLIVAMAPIFSIGWKKLDQSRYSLPTPAKMAIGMILLGLGFVLMFVAQGIAEKVGMVGPLWL